MNGGSGAERPSREVRAVQIAEAVAAVQLRIEAAARRAGRDPSGVTLVAVSKTRPLGDLLAAFAAGVRDFGENRVQEAEEKFPSLPAGCTRHLIGPVQSNKAARAARVADVVHTVDREELARRLAKAAAESGRLLPVYLEVNTGGESTKAGVSPADVPALAGIVRSHASLELRGLMAIPPPGDTRPHFVLLRSLAESVGIRGLSMGMSDDLEEAVEEGATLVRVGSALFGTRA